jgi:hypothetical protein
VRGLVVIDDRTAVHVIPRAELRHVEIFSHAKDSRTLRYQLSGASTAHTIEWKGESRPPTLKDKISIGEYNEIAADAVRTTITRGYRDVHLERRLDNVFLVRSGLVEDDARVVLCRQFVVAMADKALKLMIGSVDDAHRQLLYDIRAAAHDLVLPDWYPIQEPPT